MFAIQHNSVWLKLNEDSVLNTTLFSQLINESKLKGAFSISLDVPVEGNEVFFENRFELNSMNVIGPITFYLAKVYLENVWWLTGKLIVQRISESSLSVDLVVGLPGITSLDSKLQDLSWDTINLPTNSNPWTMLGLKMDWFNLQATEQYDENDSSKCFNFPLRKNSIFYGSNNEINPDYAGFINNYDEQNADGFIDNKYGNWNAMVPMVYCLEILRKGFEDGGYLFDTSNLPSSFRKIIQESNYDLCKLTSAFKVNAETTSSFTCNGTGISGVPFTKINFDNITQDDFLLQNTGVAGSYQIKRNGKYEGKIYVEWSAPTPNVLFTGELWFVFIVPGTSTSFQFFVGNVAINNLETIYFYFEISEDNKTLTYTHSSPGFPNVTGSFTLPSGTYIDKGFNIQPFYLDTLDPSGTVIATVDFCSIQVANLSHPQVNHFPDSIDLKKCVPQDILFKDYVNAFAATFNVDFVIDENFKLITPKLNETDIAAAPEHKENIWQSNDLAHSIEYRNAKYNKLSYRFDGTDELIAGNFKEVNPADVIGEYGTYDDLLLNQPPDVSLLGKKCKVINEVCWYVCAIEKFTVLAKWVFFTDDYAPYSVGNGENTLEMPMSPIFMRNHQFENFRMAIPVIEMEANSIDFNLTNKDVGLRISFFVELCEFALIIGGATNMPYTTTTFYHYKRTGDAFTSQTSFGLEYYRESSGTNKGIYSFWKASIDTLNMIRKVVKKVKMEMWELLDWTFRKRKYMGGVVMMPEQITISTKKNTAGFDVEMELGIEEVVVE